MIEAIASRLSRRDGREFEQGSKLSLTQGEFDELSAVDLVEKPAKESKASEKPA